MDRARLNLNLISRRARRSPCQLLIVTTAILAVCLLVLQRLKRPDQITVYSESETSYPESLGLRNPQPRELERVDGGKESIQLASSGLVNVIEEHHEVLLYWFSAAEAGVLPEKGNTLLHIDGHSDAATSTTWFNMPLFRLPKNRRELRLMMEQNDQFIQAAAATGFINRYIWVWPYFDVGWDDDYTMNMPHLTIEVSVGLMHRNGESKEEEYVLERCACAESDHFFLRDECFWIEDRYYNSVDKSLCLDRNIHGTIEFVSTQRAIELAKKGQLVTPSESVILDIDEDFYACESASIELYNSGLNSEDISLISYHIGKILCVDNAVDEITADIFFSKLITTILNIRSNCEVRPEQMCSSLLEMGTGVVKKSLHLLDEFHHVMCLQRESTLFMLGKLVDALMLCTDKQLHKLIYVGVCMRESPRGTHFIMTRGMVLCEGYNGPNSTWVTTHTLAPGELEQTTRSLEDVLRGSKPPKLVTLVRSTRDGYTPRYDAQDIERNILAVLKRVYPDEVTDDTIYYDEQLLGGPDGWDSRHRK